MNIVPSRRRIHRLRQMFEAMKKAETSTPGIVIVQSKDYLENIKGYSDLETDYMPKDWRFYISESEGMGNKLRELWGTYRDLPWANIMGDDNRPITKEWDKRLIDRLDGTNFVSCNDNWHTGGKNDLPCGATFFSGGWMRAVGYLYPPGLQHLFIDNVWKDIGLATDSWEIDESVIVEHDHASKNVFLQDDTFKKSESYFAQDRQRFIDWRTGYEFKWACEMIGLLKNETLQSTDLSTL